MQIENLNEDLKNKAIFFLVYDIQADQEAEDMIRRQTLESAAKAATKRPGKGGKGEGGVDLDASQTSVLHKVW